MFIIYTQEQIDYVHDVLVDLIISCMKTGHIPFETPQIGDWCMESTSFKMDHDNCIGRLLKVIGDSEYEIKTISGKVVVWKNAELTKIPSKYLRKNDSVLFD